MVKGTKTEEVIDKILRINQKLRLKAREVTLDMPGSMKLIVNDDSLMQCR